MACRSGSDLEAKILPAFYPRRLAGEGGRSYTEAELTKEVNGMEFHWDAAADLEDLIYESKEVSASER